jgi:membrane protease YdiL (CAAX protease family)
LFLARITDPLREKPRIIQQALLFMLVFAAALRIEWLDHKWWYHRIDNSVILADVILVSLIALVISSTLSSWRGIRHLTWGLGRWKINPGWYLLALGLWPVLVVAANALAPIFGMESPTRPYYPTIIPLQLLVIESLVWYFLFGAPLGEELGWRAFAQIRLQSRWNPLIASIIVGAFWGLWHVPLHLMGFYPVGPAGAIIRVLDIPKAIVFTWLFNRTRQSLWPVLLLHAAINTTSLFITRNYITASALLLVLSIVLVFADKMWRPLAITENGKDSSSLGEPFHRSEQLQN